MTYYREEGFEVLVVSVYNAHIGLGAEQSPNRNGRKLLDPFGVCCRESVITV